MNGSARLVRTAGTVDGSGNQLPLVRGGSVGR
jgi:hypothetical protein